MKKKKLQKKEHTNGLVHFYSSEETVMRVDEVQKKAFVKKMKKEKAKTVLRSVVCLVSAFAFLLSGTFLAKRGVEKYIVYTQEKKNEEYIIPEDIKNTMTETEGWAYIYKKNPELMNYSFPAGMSYKFALYYTKNPEVAGYLKIDGTNIDTPIAQADNNKYYLTHDFYGNYTSYGAIYASHIDNFKVIDRNTLLYGHNMKDGSRFASLKRYESMDFFKEHPLIEFNTLYNEYKWKIYAVIVTNGDVDGDDGYFFDFTFNNCSDACFEEYIKELDKRKLYNTGVDLLPTDKLLTLCTCTYEFTNARLLVIARMVRDGESVDVDTSKASYKTTRIKYPASYYDNPQKNPYKDDEKWYLY